MASSNFPDRPFRLEDTVWLLSQNVAGNYSTVRAQLWIKRNGPSASWSNNTSSFTFWINGAQVAGNNFTYDFRNSDQLLLAQVDLNIAHNADGTKPTLPIDAYANVDLMGYTDLHSSIPLPAIARQSTATFSPSNTFDAGAPVTINTNRAVSTYTHDITYSFGVLVNQAVATGVGASYSWTPPLSMLQQIPDDTIGNGTIKVVTKSGSTVIGTTSTSFFLKAPATAVPTVNVPTLADQNATVVSAVGAYVQNLSVLKVTSTASGYQGSTIDTQKVTVAGAVIPNGGSTLLTKSGTNAIVTSATDSRGRTASRTTNVTVLAYSDPNVTSFSAQRTNSAGVAQSGGAYLRFDLNAAVASLVNGTQKNAMKITVKTRPSNGAWTTRNVINTALTYNTGALITGGAVYLTTTSYDVQVTVSDNVGRSYIAQTTVSTAAVTLDLNGKNVGVGKFHEFGALDVAGDIYQNGNAVVDVTNVATASARGLVELATTAEVTAGTNNTLAVTPAGVTAALDLMPKRVITATATTGDQTGITTTHTEITGTSVSFTLAATSIVYFRVTFSTFSGSASDVLQIRVRDETTTIEEGTFPANASPTAAGTTIRQQFIGEATLAAGTHRLNASVARVVGTGSITVAKTATSPVRMTVDRIL